MKLVQEMIKTSVSSFRSNPFHMLHIVHWVILATTENGQNKGLKAEW